VTRGARRPGASSAAVRAGSDSGTTLVELLVSASVIGVLGSLAVGALVGAYSSASQTLASSANVGDERLALAEVGRQVRSGNQPLTISSRGLSFVTCADQTVPADLGRARIVEFQILQGALWTRSYRASGEAGSWRTLVAGLAGGSGFAADGVHGVRITLTVAGTAGRPATGDTLVSPRNPALPTPLPDRCP
jgi:type II secretory pathway pseudopilin PulG